MNTPKLKLVALGAMLGTTAFMPFQQSVAQTASDAVLEEVVITAERRESSLQDTALSVVGISGDAMRARGVHNTKDIGELAANLTLKEPDRMGQNRIFIRGIGGGSYQPVQVFGTGQYIDGHYMPGMVGSQMNTMDIERVEVLRGPQGTLFGKNVTGGAVNYISVKPQPNFGGDFSIRMAERGEREVTGMVNVPFTDELYGRFSAANYQYDGHYYNRYLREQQDWRDNQAYRAALRWVPNDNWTVDMTYSYNDSEGGQPGATCHVKPRQAQLDNLRAAGYGAEIDAAGWEGLPGPEDGEDGWGSRQWGSFAGVGGVEQLGPGKTIEFFQECDKDSERGDYTTSGETRPVSWEKTEGLFLTTKWTSGGEIGFLDNLDVTLNLGSRDTEHSWVIDLDYTPLPIMSFGHVNSERGVPGFFIKTDNAEVLFDMALNDKADLLIGGNIYQEEQNTGDGNCIDAYFNELEPALENDPNASVPCGPAVDPNSGGLVQQWVPTVPGFTFMNSVFNQVNTSTESQAAFAHLNYSFNDYWEMAAGVRYTKDTRSFKVVETAIGFYADNNTCNTANDYICRPDPVLSANNLAFANSGEEDFSAVTPMISLTRHLDPIGPLNEGMVYGLISQGYLTGSFNDELDADNYPALEPIQSYDPEYVTNYEIGFKGSFFNGRLSLNAGAFLMDYTDKQEEFNFNNPYIDPNDPSQGRVFGALTDIEAVVNAGEVQNTGIEIEARGRPWANGFVTMDFSTLINNYKEFELPSIQTPDGREIAGDSIDMTQRHIHDRTPTWTLNINLGHTFTFDNGGELTPSLGMYTQGGYEWAWDSLQFPFVPPLASAPESVCYQDSYAKFRTRVNYRSPGGNWEASLFGENITDERIINRCQWNRGGTIKRTWEAPKSWGMEFKAYF